jgi:hypothetical protein
MFNFLKQNVTQSLRLNALASPDMPFVHFVSLVLPLQIQLQWQILGANGNKLGTITRDVGSN